MDEGRDKGNLISIITTDIELLEVFYAHTISPIAIAVLTSLVMILFIGGYHPAAGVFELAAYLVVGVVIPLWNGRRGGDSGMKFRTEFGELNSFVLDSLRGLDETIQYQQGAKRADEMQKRSDGLAGMQKKLSDMEGSQRSVTNLVILIASFGMLFLTLNLYGQGSIGYDGVLTCTIAMMGSFGPVVALSSLSNNLNQTLASGERVLSILEEKPQVEEVEGEWTPEEKHFSGADAEHVTFAYDNEVILDDYSLDIPAGKILGIHGASGSGKSTLLNCIATVIQPTGGSIQVEGDTLQSLKGKALAEYRGKKVGYLFQNFELLDNLTGRENILLPTSLHGVSEAESSQRLKQLADYLEITDVLDKFPSKMSGGQRQRVAAARALILHPQMILADEPTGALDSKNARSLMEKLSGLNRDEQATILMVTHDSNAASFCKRILFIQDGVIFHELRRGDESQQEFYGRILKVMAQLGGGSANVL